jgi:hypothetical protein
VPPKNRFTGTVGVCGMDTGRFSEFALSLARLDLPPGWEIQGALNYDENHARNYLVESFTGEYIWFIDDDQAFPSKILHKLMSHDVDVVAPLVLQRRIPFAPVAIKDGYHVTLKDPPGLMKVDLTGTSGMLIKRSIFACLEKPYFVSRDLEDGSHMPSDTNFCRKLSEAGIDLHVDTSQTMTHFNVMGVTPRYDGKWVTGFSVGNEEFMKLER